MDLILIRHAEAFEHDPARWPDDRDRPLTPRGIKRFRHIARAIAPALPEDAVVWSSALERAWQTAVLLASAANVSAPTVWRLLEPGGSLTTITRRIAARREVAGIVLVGHEPDLGRIAAHWLLGHADQEVVGFKKGAAACIRLDADPQPGRGVLQWLVTPRLLLDHGR